MNKSSPKIWGLYFIFLLVSPCLPCQGEITSQGLGTLKKVNLIRNGGAEGSPEVWREEYHPPGLANTAKITKKDSIDAYTGSYCFSIDTKEESSLILPYGYEFGYIFQDLIVPKKVSDIDTLSWFMKVAYLHNDSGRTSECGMMILMNDPHIAGPPRITDTLSYLIRGPFFPEIEDREHAKIIMEDMIPQDKWEGKTRDLYKDIVELKGWSLDINIITTGFWNAGYRNYDSLWLAQLALFDEAKLYGYADKDIELVKILSGSEIPGDYTPSVEIHNNGKEDEQNIPLKAVITDSSGDTLYNETIEIEELRSDSSSIVEFPLWSIEPEEKYKLVILTGNYMGIKDECEDNDYLEKELNVQAVTEESPGHRDRAKISPTISRAGSYLKDIVEVYDINGRLIKTTKDKPFKNLVLPSGIYFLRLERDNTLRKIILIR